MSSVIDSAIAEPENGVGEENQPMALGNEPQAGREHSSDGASPIGRQFLVFSAMPSWLASMIVHVILLLILALITLPMQQKPAETELTLSDSEPVNLQEELPVFQLDQQLVENELQDLEVTDIPFQPETDLVSEQTIISEANDLDSVAYLRDVSPLGLEFAPQGETKAVGGVTGSGVDGRGQASRSRLLREAGGTKESEKAVMMALK